MNRQYRQLRLAYAALLPSLSSAILVIGLTIAILVIADRAFIGNNPLLYQYLFGPEGLVQAVQPQSFSSLGDWHGFSWHHDGGFVYSYLLIALMAAAIYTALEVGAITLTRAQRSAAELRAMRSIPKAQMLRELVWRALLRFAVLAGGSLYVLYFFRVLLPYCTAQSQFGVATIGQLWHGGYILLAGLLLCSGLHALVVLLRIFCLRPRLFGGTDVLLMSESKD